MRFLTVVPVPETGLAVTPQNIARGLPYFPLVGALLGSGLALLYRLLAGWLPPAIVPLVLVIALLSLTGALHFDGFLDCCDGLFGYHSPARRLEIMRDSRVGSFAVAGGWALLSMKYAALAQLTPSIVLPALIVGPLLGRAALVAAVLLFPYGRSEGLGLEYKRFNSWRNCWPVSLGVMLLAGLALGLGGAVLAVLVLPLAWFFGRWVMIKLPEGLTGDAYGALAEMTEMLVWLVLAAGPGLFQVWL